MRAGQDDRVGAPLLVRDEAGCDFGGDRLIRHRLAGHFRLGIARQPRRADQRDAAGRGMGADEVLRIVARDRTRRRQDGDAPRRRGERGRLDRRHRADEGQRETLAQGRQRQRGGRVAGDHDEIGSPERDQLFQNGKHAFPQRGLLKPPIGKGSLIGGIDQVGIRPAPGDLLRHGETAHPGIEHQNARTCHRLRLADGLLNRSGKEIGRHGEGSAPSASRAGAARFCPRHLP